MEVGSGYVGGMSRRLDWPGCRNVRDLGGLPTRDGAVIRPRALIRADSLDRLTDDGLSRLKELGVSRILDLRNADEAVVSPHPFAGDDNLYRLVPMIDPRRERLRDRTAERTLGDIYASSLHRNARSIMDGLAAIADAPDGAVVVHCAVGKDRTGMIVALVLSLAGVADDVIAEDYALSGECLRDEFEQFLAGVADDTERARVRERMSCHPETMLHMLAHLRAHYGDAEGYAKAHKLDADRLDRIRQRLRADT